MVRHEMGLLDKTLSPLKDYISLSDLLLLIGENTQTPLYDICIYLRLTKFGELITFYKINQDFVLYECEDHLKDMNGLNGVSSIIDDIANNLKQDESDRKLVVQSLLSLNDIRGWQEHIKRYFYQEWQKEFYFKRQDLLAFEPIKDCLTPNFAIQDEYREIVRLRKQLQQILNEPYLARLISQNDRLRKENETLEIQQQQNSELQNRIAELESQLVMQSNDTPTQPSAHTNTALTALFDVINTHWQNPKKPPKQQFIKNWIVEKYPSIDPSKALWIDKIIRHQDQK